MLSTDLSIDEVEWIKNAILDVLENNYRGVQPAREEIIYSTMDKFADMSVEEWQTIHVLYQKLSQ